MKRAASAFKNYSKVFVRKCSTSINDSTSIVDIILTKPIGSTKTVKGWVKSLRKMKNLVFLDVNDGSCGDSLQVVSPKKVFSEPLQWGSSVNATGKLQTNPKGQLELQADTLKVLGKCDVTDKYPFTPKQKQSYDYYRQYLHLRPQLSYFSSMLRVRNAAMQGIHNFFSDNGFIGIHTPVITSNDCEGAGETFIIKPHSSKLIHDMKKKGDSDEAVFFGSQAFLTVSGQLHLEVITRCISKVYTFNPTFRAENSKSRLHLSEFYMVEMEEAFVDDLNNVLKRMESLVKKVTSDLLSNNSSDIDYMLKHNETNVDQHMKILENLVNKPFSVITFSEAKSLIKKNENRMRRSEAVSDYNLSKEEELFLVQHNDYVPVFVVDFPKYGKPFYMKESSENIDFVKGVDLLVANVGELCGGSLREDNYDSLKQKLTDVNLLESMHWYLELRKYGNVPTGGFGMGFERFLQFLLNCGNIKDTIPFPRWPHGLQL